MCSREKKILGINVLVEVMAVVVEETPVPTIMEDPIPKGKVVPDPLRDGDDGPVEAPELTGTERTVVDEMG